MRSCDKLNTLYLHFLKTYGHQTRQGFPLKLPPLKSMTLWSSDQRETTWQIEKNIYFHFRNKKLKKKIYISTLASLLTTKLDWVLTSKRRFRTQTHKSSPTSCTKLHCFKIILCWYLVWWGKFFVFNPPVVFSLAFINSCLKRLRIQGKSLNPGKETSCHRNLIKIYHKNIRLHLNIKLTSFLQDINWIKFIYGFE